MERKILYSGLLSFSSNHKWKYHGLKVDFGTDENGVGSPVYN